MFTLETDGRDLGGQSLTRPERSAPNYRDEVAGLERAYEQTRASLGVGAAEARSILQGNALVCVGAGGAEPAAIYAAQLHQDKVGRLAKSTRPLDFLQMDRTLLETSLLIFSAQARHPDTAAVLRRARDREIPTVLVTQRDPQELRGLLGIGTVLRLPLIGGRDGFLATRSLISMMTASAMLYAGDDVPERLDVPLPADTDATTRGRMLVLHGREGEPAARDLEVRLHELGLGAVQVADFRNMAHGRHVGFVKHLEDTTVVAIYGGQSEGIAVRTLSKFPRETHLIELRTTESSVSTPTALVAATARLVQEVARGEGVEASRPRVGTFGRSLYHLTVPASKRVGRIDAVDRKLRALNSGAGRNLHRSIVSDSFRAWRRSTNATDILGLVCDYDGTVVRTGDRFEPPDDIVKSHFLRLLDMGLPLGFASGRGDSLYRSLKSWVPQALHQQVTLALHNGAWIQPLSEDLAEAADVNDVIVEASGILRDLSTRLQVGVRVGREQISLEPLNAFTPVAELGQMVNSALAASKLDVRVAASAHSVDVSIPKADKTAILEYLKVEKGSILAVGDQGQEGGNDHALLDSVRVSVSVRHCSRALDRCWNIARPGRAGPEALIELLKLLQPRGPALRLKVPHGVD